MAWRLAKSLEVLRSQVNSKWPKRSKASDGTIGDAAHSSRDSDHNPWIVDRGVGVVSAIDFTHDPKVLDCNVLVNALIASRDPRIKYVIWNGQILSSQISPWKWRRYGGPNKHTKHFHLSVHANKASYDSTQPWKIEK